MRRYVEALLLVQKAKDEAETEDSSAMKGGLGITHLDSALLMQSEKQDALLPNVNAKAQTKNDTK